VLERVCADARIENITPHTLRHTFASVAADLGFSELTIAALLGHAARGVTQRYVHIDEALRLAADRVSAEIEALLAGKAAIERRVPAAIGSAGD
jgi:integrase